MALRDLPNEEMLTVTAPWIDPQHEAHQVLSSRPLTAPIVSEVTAAHLEVQGTLGTSQTARILELQTEQKELDDRHDDLVRAIYYRLLGEEFLTSDPDEAAEYRVLRHLFAPEGTSLINRSHRHEAGHARSVESLLTPEHRQRLVTLATGSGTLLDAAQEYIDLAKRIGELDHERRMLDEPPAAGCSANVKARVRWIRAVSMVRMAAEVIGPADRALTSLMLAVDRAEKQASVRRQLNDAGSATAAGGGAAHASDVGVIAAPIGKCAASASPTGDTIPAGPGTAGKHAPAAAVG